MSKIIERLQQFAESQYDSMREFERDSKVTQGVFSKSFNNHTEVRTDSVEKFAESFPQVSAEWLLRGIGPMILSSEDSTKDALVDYLQRKVADQESLIHELYQEIGMLEAKLDLERKGETAHIVGGSSDAIAV